MRWRLTASKEYNKTVMN